MSPDRVETEVDGQAMTLSNLEKVFYPATGFTKGAVISYYAKVAEAMLPHLCARPVTLRRYPEGVTGESFFEKHLPRHAPPWIHTTRVPKGFSERSRSKSVEDIVYAVLDDRPSLVWAANLAAIELHVPLWRTGAGPPPSAPDFMVFDLDPGPGTTVVECCLVGTWIEERLRTEELAPSLPKTSGSKGLQLYAPLNGPIDWTNAREWALEIARAVERDHPDLVVSNMRKELRGGRVLIDWSQNHPAKTTVAVYSLRARPEPTVSTPVSWAEVAECLRDGDAARLSFSADQVLDRLERVGDLFAPLGRGPDSKTPAPRKRVSREAGAPGRANKPSAV